MSSKNTQEIQNKYVTIGRAAQYLGVSVDTIRRWELSGKLHAKRLDGKNRYFAVSDLRRFRSERPLSTAGVAARLRVSESTVRRLGVQGLLVPVRGENGRRMYSAQAVSDYMIRKSGDRDPVAIHSSASPIKIGRAHV